MFSKLKKQTTKLHVKQARKFLNLPFNTLFNHITMVIPEKQWENTAIQKVSRGQKEKTIN